LGTWLAKEPQVNVGEVAEGKEFRAVEHRERLTKCHAFAQNVRDSTLQPIQRIHDLGLNSRLKLGPVIADRVLPLQPGKLSYEQYFEGPQRC